MLKSQLEFGEEVIHGRAQTIAADMLPAPLLLDAEICFEIGVVSDHMAYSTCYPLAHK